MAATPIKLEICVEKPSKQLKKKYLFSFNSIYCKASHGSGDDEIEYHYGVSCGRVPGKKIHFTADLRCPTVLCAIGAKAQEKDPHIKRPFSITKQDVEASST